MKTIRYFFIPVIGLLSFIILGKSINKPAAAGETETFSYEGENVGYSDITKLYSPDSTQIGKSFFERNTVQHYQAHISCKVRKTTLRQNKNGNLVCFEIVEPQITLKNNDIDINQPEISEEIIKPVFSVISQEGSIVNVQTDSAISQASSAIAKDIISHFQFVRSAADTVEWQSTEENISGMFLAKYKRVSRDSSAMMFKKSFAGFTKTSNMQKNQKLHAESMAMIRTDMYYGLSVMQLSENLLTLFDQDTVSMNSSKINISLLEKSKRSSEECANLISLNNLANYRKSRKLSEGLTEAEINNLAYKHTLGGENLGSLMRKLSAIPISDTQSLDQCVLQLRALFYTDPSACTQGAEILQQEPYGTVSFNALSDALTQAETAPAINAIVTVIKARKTDVDALITLLPALAITKTPTDEAIALMKELSFQPNDPAIVSTAQLALGGIACNLYKLNPQKSEVLTRYIIDKMESDPDTIQKILVLGNTCSPFILPILKSYVLNKEVSVQVKSAAIEATRLIPGNEVNILLDKWKTHKDPDLQKTVKEVILFRKDYAEYLL